MQIIATKRCSSRKLNKQSSSFCARVAKNVNKIRLCFLPFLSPLFFFLFYLFIFSLLWFSSNSLRSTLLLRQFLPLIARFFPPVSSPPPLFQLLFFECMPFPTPSKLFTSGLRYFQPWSRIFSTSVVLTAAFIRLSLPVTFLFSRFPTFRSSFSLSLLFIFRPFVCPYTSLFKSPR